MEALTQIHLAHHEQAEPPELEKSNFRYSFSFLPKEERQAINSVYAFCSYIDDIVDSTPSNNSIVIQKKMDRLAWWDNEIERIYSDSAGPLIAPFGALVKRFNIPGQYFHTLIDGCRRDLVQKRYETFEDLKNYCYSVASVVGLMSIEIFGYRYEETKNYAINLGYALQLTNILRDIKIDKDRGYIYLPAEDMRRFGYSQNDLLNEVYNDNFIEMMTFQANRAKKYYHKARTSLRTDERTNTIAPEIMDAIYYRLLEKIELNDYNVYRKKIRVATAHKLLIAMKHWLSVGMFVGRFKKGPYS